MTRQIILATTLALAACAEEPCGFGSCEGATACVYQINETGLHSYGCRPLCDEYNECEAGQQCYRVPGDVSVCMPRGTK